MGKSSKPKIEVTEYYMSQHFGICLRADSILAITIKEKEAWAGEVSALGTISINKPELFGGNKKEGGAVGTVHWLPGEDDQVLPDSLATRLGRANGADAPGYRGIATAWFVGSGPGSLATKLGGGSSGGGFLWSANSPYLPGVWIKVRRAPVGLDPDYALVPRAGDDEGGTILAAYNLADTFVPLGEGDPGWPGHTGLHPASITIGPYGHPFQVITTQLVMDGDDLWVINGEDGEHQYFINEVLAVIPAGETFTLQLRNLVGTVFGFGGIEATSLPNTPYDANPAHIIYECLTDVDWGMGSPTTAIDTASFEEAAVTLYNEGFGLSMIWTRQASIQNFIQEVLDHIQAVVFVDPSTGLLTMKLIRGDYDVETLPVLTPDNAELGSFSRKLWGEITNEIIVTWTNPENEQEETVTIQDLASIATQGGIVSDSRNYYGVRYADLATRLAVRDLASAGAPLASCEAEVDRSMWQLRPASVVKLEWPEHGLSGVVMRVTSVDYGKPGDMTIKLNMLEDVFGTDAGDYVAPPSSGWEDPSAPPDALDEVLIFTLPLFMALDTTVAGFIDNPSYPEVLAGILGSTDNSDAYSYQLWDEVALPDGSPQWQQIGTNNIIGRAELTTNVDAEASTIISALDNFTGLTEPTLGGFAIIGDGTEEESEIAMITDAGVTFTLARGVLDTVPKAWPAGTPVWFVDGETLFEDPLLRSAGETVSYKLLPQTSQGALELGSAALQSYTLTERPWLPSRPANVQVDSVMFNTAATPVDMTERVDPWVTATWANRNRLTEDSQVLSWTDATVTPEDGQTTTIEVLTDDLVTVLATHDGLSGTSFDVPDASFGSETIVALRFSAARTDDDGEFVSLQAHVIWVQIAPTRLTEDGDARLTEDGERRALED